MKKILKGPAVFRAKCNYCECEFEYDFTEVRKVDKDFKYVECPGCKRSVLHSESSKSNTSTVREDTMST